MRKFIVTSDGRFKYGDVNMHKDLLAPGENCLGGGMYEFDYVNGRMLLSGRSFDFGRVRWGMLDSLVLPASLSGLDIYYEDVPLRDMAPLVFGE